MRSLCPRMHPARTQQKQHHITEAQPHSPMQQRKAGVVRVGVLIAFGDSRVMGIHSIIGSSEIASEGWNTWIGRIEAENLSERCNLTRQIFLFTR